MAQRGGKEEEFPSGTGSGSDHGTQPPATRSVLWPGPHHPCFDQCPELMVVIDESTNGETLQWENGNWRPLPKIRGDEEAAPNGCVPHAYARGIVFNPESGLQLQEVAVGEERRARPLPLVLYRRAGLFFIWGARGHFTLVTPPFNDALARAAEIFCFRKMSLILFPALVVPVPAQVEMMAANVQLIRDSARPASEELTFLRPQPAYDLVASLPRLEQEELIGTKPALPPPLSTIQWIADH